MGTRSAIQVVNARAFESVAFPVLGSGSGGFAEQRAAQIILDALEAAESKAVATLVRFA